MVNNPYFTTQLLRWIIDERVRRDELELNRFWLSRLHWMLSNPALSNELRNRMLESERSLFEKITCSITGTTAQNTDYQALAGDYKSQWEREFGSLTDPVVSRGIDLAIAALEARRKGAR